MDSPLRDMQKVKPSKAWAIVQIRDLGGEPIEPWIDYSDLFKSRESAKKELDQFGTKKDFRIISVLISHSI